MQVGVEDKLLLVSWFWFDYDKRGACGRLRTRVSERSHKKVFFIMLLIKLVERV